MKKWQGNVCMCELGFADDRLRSGTQMTQIEQMNTDVLVQLADNLFGTQMTRIRRIYTDLFLHSEKSNTIQQ